MPKLLFSDEQKAGLAKEAGITGVPDTNTFDREYDPATGEQKLYMKLGNGSKFFGAKPTTVKEAPTDQLNSQVDYMKTQYGGKTMQDLYSAMISTTPSDKGAIRDKIGQGPGGIYSNLEGITQQIQNLQKMKAGNQAEIFRAVDPATGKPVDPRIAVATFQNRQKAFTEQENNLRALQDMYNSQLDQLADSEYQRQSAENKKNETALGYLKSIEDKDLAAQKVAEDKRQFETKLAEEKRQFNIEQGINTPEDIAPVSVDKITSYVTQSRGKDKFQCGEVSNDYWKMKTGSSLGVGDSYESKVSAIEKVGKSETPVQGGVFALPTNTKYGHTGIVQSVNSDGSIEVVEANREGTKEGTAPKVTTYTAEQAKKMTFSVAPQGTNQTATAKKPATFNAFIEKYQIPDIQLDEKGTEEMLQAVLKEYPTETLKTVADALANRAPAGVKTAIEKYKNAIIEKEGEAATVAKLITDVPTLTEATTKTLIRGLENSGKDTNTIITTLYKSGFFDTFGPWSAGSWGNDDQWEVVRDYAQENGGLDVNKVVEEIKKKEKELKKGTESTK